MKLLVAGLAVLFLTTAMTYADRTVLLRIPTGSRQVAHQATQELERIGLGRRFDHVRTSYEIEAQLDTSELARLYDQKAVYGPGGPLGNIDDWWIARNMTAQQPGEPHGNSAPPSGNYLPVDKRRYHPSREIEHILRAFSRQYRDHVGLRNLGRTMRGGILWALVITGNVRGRDPSEWRPRVLMTGSPHGNDMVGQEMCLWVAQYLCEAYQSVSVIRDLLDRIELVIVPDPSPDASAIGSRYTTRGVDLDRAFPDRVAKGSDPQVPEPEIEALVEWLGAQRFMVSMSFLGGGGGPAHAGTVIRYPWNNELKRVNGQTLPRLPSRTPDDRNLRWLARKYAETHPTMANQDPRGHGPDAGTVNGAAWYPRHGSLQDWIYHETGSLHLDLVISHYLKPLPQDLPTYWRQNREAILSLLRSINEYGLRGTVVDAETKAPLPDAQVHIHDLNDRLRQLHSVQPSEDRGGGFGRFLVPGRYKALVEAPGYHTSQAYYFTINSSRRIFRLNVELRTH